MSLGTYTVPAGSSLGELLGLKNSHAAGISTKQRPNGLWDLLEWPSALGAIPTQSDVNDVVQEAAALRRADALVVAQASIHSSDPDAMRLRAALHVVMQSLVQARDAINTITLAIGSASNFADLQVRAALIAPLSNRTWDEAMQAAESAIHSELEG